MDGTKKRNRQNNHKREFNTPFSITEMIRIQKFSSDIELHKTIEQLH